jgi:hypothetical protein
MSDTGTAMARSASAFMARCHERMIGKIELHRMMWLFGEHTAWSIDLAAGTIRFEFEHPQVVTARIQVIGHYDPGTGVFRWGWHDPEVPDALRQHAQVARAWGRAHELAAFTDPSVACTQEDAMTFVAVAKQLCGAECAFSGPAQGVQVFVTFGEVEIDLRPCSP